jgi:hypothetical protein
MFSFGLSVLEFSKQCIIICNVQKKNLKVHYFNSLILTSNVRLKIFV